MAEEKRLLEQVARFVSVVHRVTKNRLYIQSFSGKIHFP